MALSSLIQFGDNNIKKYSREYQLTNVTCHFKREVDSVGPTSDTSCDSLKIFVINESEEDFFLYDWFDKGESYTGRILLEGSDSLNFEDIKVREILFEEAQCFSLGEIYKLDETRRTLYLELSASKISINDIEF